MESMVSTFWFFSQRCSAQWFPRACGSCPQWSARRAFQFIHLLVRGRTLSQSWLPFRRSSPQKRHSSSDRNRPPDSGTGSGRQTERSCAPRRPRQTDTRRPARELFNIGGRRWQRRYPYYRDQAPAGTWRSHLPRTSAFFKESQTCSSFSSSCSCSRLFCSCFVLVGSCPFHVLADLLTGHISREEGRPGVFRDQRSRQSSHCSSGCGSVRRRPVRSCGR